MNHTSKRDFDPTEIRGDYAIEEADIVKAFYEQQDPDEDLYYLLFSPAWVHLKTSEQFDVLSKVAALVEGAQAAKISVTTQPPVNK